MENNSTMTIKEGNKYPTFNLSIKEIDGGSILKEEGNLFTTSIFRRFHESSRTVLKRKDKVIYKHTKHYLGNLLELHDPEGESKDRYNS
jgi:hypothetical protein